MTRAAATIVLIFGVVLAVCLGNDSVPLSAKSALIAALITAVVWLSSSTRFPSDRPIRTINFDVHNARAHLGVVFCFGATLFALVFDVGSIMRSESNLRYALAAMPALIILARILGPSRIPNPPTLGQMLAVFLFVYGSVGWIMGQVLTHPVDNTAVAVLPFIFGLLPLWYERGISEREVRALFQILSWGSTLYLAMHLLSRQGLSFVDPSAYSHEKAFLLWAALATTFISRRYFLFVLNLVLGVLIFLNYPAATYPVTIVMGMIGAGLAVARFRKAASVALGVIALAYALALTISLQGAMGFATQYLLSVGKSNTASTRFDLLNEAFSQIGKQPAFGGGFSGETTLYVLLNGRLQLIPVHNDFVEFALIGGVVALGAFMGWIIWALRRGAISGNSIAHGSRAWRLNVVLMSTVTAALGDAAFNPVLVNIASAGFLYTTLGVLSVLSAPIRNSSQDSSPPSPESPGLSGSLRAAQ